MAKNYQPTPHLKFVRYANRNKLKQWWYDPYNFSKGEWREVPFCTPQNTHNPPEPLPVDFASAELPEGMNKVLNISNDFLNAS